jgi:hypothetical protein
VPVIVTRQTFGCEPNVLVEMLQDRPEQWLATFVRLACHDGETEGLRAYPELHDMPLDPKPTCVVTVGEPRWDPTGVVSFPLRWIAIGYRVVARSFAGSIEIQPSDRGTIVSISGSCKGEHGNSFDSRRASRVAAEAVLRSLLSNLADAVTAAIVPEAVTQTGPTA